MSTEYEQTLIFIRFFLDYRVKIFTFYITVNGILFTGIVLQGGPFIADFFVCLFGVVVTFVCMLADWRAVSLADKYREAAIELEDALGFNSITRVHDYAKEEGIGFRHLFSAFYAIVAFSWLFRLLFVDLKLLIEGPW